MLPLSALVVTADRRSLGQLGRRVREHCPSPEWAAVEYAELNPLSPQAVRLDQGDSDLKFVLVTTVRPAEAGNEQAGGGRLTRAVDAATAAVLRARHLGAESVALPLLGTGADGLPVDVVAAHLLRKLYDTASRGETPPLVVVMVADPNFRRHILAGWAEAVERAFAAGADADPEAVALLTEADRLALERGADAVTAADVVLAAVLAALEGTEGDGDFGLTVRGVAAAAAHRGADRNELLSAVGLKAQTLPPRRPTTSLEWQSAVADALDRAGHVRSICRHSSISAAHVLAGAVLGQTLPEKLLRALRSSSSQLIDELRVQLPGPAWDAVFGAVALEAPFVGDRVPSDNGDVAIEDQLGMDVYVSMLAGLIARRATAMPVSVGLFGPWGSGKSYFMELMRQRVQGLAGVSPDYHNEIVQLRFNAWHYADTDLWASLAGEFFRQLGRPEVDPIPARREAIERERREHQELRAQLDASLQEAQDRTKNLADQLARARADKVASARARRRALMQATVRRLTTPEGELARVQNELGLGSPEAVIEAAQDVRATGTEVVAVRRLLAHRRVRIAFVCLLLGIAALAVAVAFPSVARWVAGGAGLSLTAALAVAGSALGRARSLVGRMHKIAVEAAAVADECEDAVGIETDELREAEARELAIRAEVDQAASVAAALDQEIAELAPEQRLYQFLANRSTSEEYRGRLGVISTIRRDFEELVALMRRWRERPAPGGPRPIDRIVLYIDDLDRCEPPQVVAVLQAVHLLLAMELFVVVVGVDPRWLHRSLTDQYPTLMSEADAAYVSEGPERYLQKIFQVPFMLPSLSGAAVGRLLRHLAGRDDGLRPVASPAINSLESEELGPLTSSTTRTAASRVFSSSAESAPTASALPPLPSELAVETNSEVAEVMRGRTPAPTRGITDGELAVLEHLHALTRIFRGLGVGDRFAARRPVIAGIVPGGHDNVTALGRAPGPRAGRRVLGRRGSGSRGWSAGAGVQTGDRGAAGEDELGPGVAGGEVSDEHAGVAGQAGGGGEQSQPQSLGFPAPGGVVAEAEHLGPGDELAGQLHDRAPDAVLVEPVQGQVRQSGVLGGADAVLAAGAAAVS